jgi:hypothetical protein
MIGIGIKKGVLEYWSYSILDFRLQIADLAGRNHDRALIYKSKIPKSKFPNR